MEANAKLTNREAQIAELFAWGATKKDVANMLNISAFTVENHTRKIYEKTCVTKVNELSAWWFCTHFNISVALSPLKQKVIAALMLLLVIPQVFHAEDAVRTFGGNRIARSTRKCGRRDNLILD